jgi:hypothetical protein
MTSNGDNKFCLKRRRVMPPVAATSHIAMKSARPESRTLSFLDGGAYGEVGAPGERRLASERRSADLLLYNLSLICSALVASATDIGDDDWNAQPQGPATGGSVVFSDALESFQKRFRKAVLRRDDELVSERQLHVAEFGAMKGDHVFEDDVNGVLEGALLQQPQGHLREHGCLLGFVSGRAKPRQLG